MTRLAPLLLLIAAPGAAEPLSAEEIFARALRAQGRIRHDQVRDLRVHFKGQVIHPKQGTQTAIRDYWYRAEDRAFRVRTSAVAGGKIKAERGIFPEAEGRQAFWARAGRRGILRLSERNRDDAKSIESIRHDREEFEHLARMVLLSRLDDGKTRMSRAAPEPVPLERDLPYEAGRILGRDRGAHRYHVIDLAREGEPLLRLFVRTDDYTVRKAVQFDPEQPDRIRGVFYLGPYPSPDAPAPRIPYYFSSHDSVPVNDTTKETSCQAHGELTVELNRGLTDADLFPVEE